MIIVSSFALAVFLGNNKIVFLPIKQILIVLGVFIGISIPEEWGSLTVSVFTWYKLKTYSFRICH